MTAFKQINRYEIKAEIGRGGMSTVYLAHDPRFRRDVAIKVLPSQFTHDPAFRARFEREAQTIAALEHFAIVPVYDFGEEDEQPYLVMRYMPGGSLAERLAQGSLLPNQTVPIVTRIASALDEAHKLGIIHRDLKPGNILFDQFDKAYLSDFGIVKLTEATATFTGTAILGTPAYMSPEQGRGDSTIDGRSDVYALGAMLFEMLTGQQPYEADTPMGIVVKHITDPIPHILEIKEDLPVACDTLIHRAMAKKPEERFSSAGKLAEAIIQATSSANLPPTNIPVNPVAETLPANIQLPETVLEKPERKYPLWLWFVVLGSVVICGLGVGGYATGFFAQATSTITPMPTLDLEPTLSMTPINTPSPTFTAVPATTSTSLPTNTTTPTKTTTPSATPSKTPTPTTIATETATVTPTSPRTSVSIPRLISPIFGEYQSPIVFQWSSTTGASYRVTLTHTEKDTVYTSDWIRGGQWTFDIPAAEFGNWEWFVTTEGGVKSETAVFTFNPFPGAGSESGSSDRNPTATPVSNDPTITPDPYP